MQTNEETKEDKVRLKTLATPRWYRAAA